jgi:CRISPR/Cas system-associated endoribonuclease Cas2
MRRNQGKSIKESKLAAVQNSAFKGKAGPSQRKPMEHLTEFFKAKNMDTIMTSFLQQPITKEHMKDTSGKVIEDKDDGHKNFRPHVAHGGKIEVGFNKIIEPNMSRPPDDITTPPLGTSSPIILIGETNGEGEIFVDANDQGRLDLSDLEMEVEVVKETTELQS